MVPEALKKHLYIVTSLHQHYTQLATATFIHTVAATLVHTVSDTNQNQITMQKFAQSSGNIQIETATFTSSSSRSSNYTVTITFTPQQWQDANFYTLITTLHTVAVI